MSFYTTPLDTLLGSSPRLRPKEREGLRAAELYSCAAILLHLPRRYVDRCHVRPFAACMQGVVNTNARVLAHNYRRLGRKTQLIIDIQDDSGCAELVCFGRANIRYLLPVGAIVRITGNFAIQYRKIQATQFEFEPSPLTDVPREQRQYYSRFDKIMPIYSVPTAISQQAYFRIVLRVLAAALSHTNGGTADADSAIPDNAAVPDNAATGGKHDDDTNALSPEEVSLKLRSYIGPGVFAALYAAHLPSDQQAIGTARQALARHELLALQLKMQQPPSAGVRASSQAQTAPTSIAGETAASPPNALSDLDAILNFYPLQLSFDLTAGQRRALQVIYADIYSARAMKRLLQGDVGVGKTLVALLAIIPVLRSGAQAAFMVPTELLAHQQSASARALFRDAEIDISFLSGSLTARQREDQLQRIAAGDTQLVVGTHALFSGDVAFANLKMIIVDEQHRFGVRQRMALVEKGDSVHQLHMTATPIPRTLALARYSGFDITNIHDQPRGRQKIITKIIAQKNEQRVYDAVLAELRRGHQAYFIYPLIEDANTPATPKKNATPAAAQLALDDPPPHSPPAESDPPAEQVAHHRPPAAPPRSSRPSALALRSAEQMAHHLQHAIFPSYRVACIHSRTPEDEKRLAMERFAAGDIHILVATSVIEVGVDVANATCIAIHHAERFGLASLHQLRGRVGRSPLQSYAFLIYQDDPPLNDDAKSRLKVIYQHTDGFFISEADLFIRGPGELMGTKQSGASNLKVAHFPKHLDLLPPARLLAQHLLAQRLLAADSDGALPPEVVAIQELFGAFDTPSNPRPSADTPAPASNPRPS